MLVDFLFLETMGLIMSLSRIHLSIAQILYFLQIKLKIWIIRLKFKA